MKTKLQSAILILALLCSCRLFAQNKIEEEPLKKIEYDFNGRSLRKLSIDDIQEGGFYQIVIHNLNSNLYKVTVNSKDTTTSKALQMPTFASMDLSGISSAIASVEKATTSTIHSFNNGRTSTIEKDKNIIKEFEKFKKQLQTLVGKLSDLKTQLDNIQLEIFKAQLNYSIEAAPKSTNFNFDTIANRLFILKADVYKVQKEINAAQQAYVKFADDNKKEIAENETYTANDKAITDAFTKLITATTEFVTAVSAEKARDLLLEMLTYQNNAKTDYTSLPYQFRNDLAKVSIKIEPRKPEFKLNSYSTDLHFPLKRRAYAAVGVSFYTSLLHDEPYSVIGRAIKKDSIVYDVAREGKPFCEVGITALLRLGRKSANKENFGYHFSIGPGLSLGSTIKPRLLTGGGLSWGKKHMFTVDGGIIAGSVGRLTGTINPNSNSITVKPEQVMVSRLSASGFLALGYLYRFP